MKIESTPISDIIAPGVKKYFKQTPQYISEIAGGGNNRLFRFKAGSQELLAKFYRRDGRQRLDREFMASSFLSSIGIKVPKAFFADHEHQFAVYSLEPGKTKEPSDTTKGDVERIADFMLALHSIANKKIPTDFLEAGGALRSYQDYINLMDGRMNTFKSAFYNNRLHPKAQYFAQDVKAIELVEDLIQQAISGLSSRVVNEQISPDHMRITPIDIGPHNALFNNGGICFIDLEFTGWDEPLRTIVEFTHHQANRGIPFELRQHFRDYFLSKTDLPEEVVKRWIIDDKLMEIIWLTTQLQRMTPERIEGLKFANPNFDLDKHIEGSIRKATERIEDFSINI